MWKRFRRALKRWAMPFVKEIAEDYVRARVDREVNKHRNAGNIPHPDIESRPHE